MPAMVLVSTSGHGSRRVLIDKVQAVLCNRIVDNKEQYLIQWKTEDSNVFPPLSWHAVQELVHCLDEVQEYLDVRERWKQSSLSVSKKRKTPDAMMAYERRPSPFERHNASTPMSRSSSISDSPAPSVTPGPMPEVYNGILDEDEHGFIFCRFTTDHNVTRIDINHVPTPDMENAARQSRVSTALTYIRAEYVRRLKKLPGAPIQLINIVDDTTPSLRFKYIPNYILTDGVHRLSLDTQQGCTKCSPHMGRNIGCEYTKKCDCLEYAAVDESRITDPAILAEYNHAIATHGPTVGFPKKFPYFSGETKREKPGCLVPFYLHSRRPIYECNSKCHCGPGCRNKNVQFGRKVELEIFRTAGGRGWGLRCMQDLHEGEFIDTYRGEIITDAEATRRESSSANSKLKASYLYSLDKFAETESLSEEDIYVVDGEFMGGPTKFMNHSCEPNCRQYTVSYNKHDYRVYDIAFFACRAILKGEELTFDYLDKDDGEVVEEGREEEGAVPCLCGAEKCRQWLWT